MIPLKNKTVIISKINQIGDVLFALPIATALKQHEPSCKILFLARPLVNDLVAHYRDIDGFIDAAALLNLPEAEAVKQLQSYQADIFIHVFPWKALAIMAKQAKIPYRVGVWGRFFHWFTCNRLVVFSRKKSSLHETQLDMKLLKPFGIKTEYSLNDIVDMRHFTPFSGHFPLLDTLKDNKFNLIIHPLTRGRKIEWTLPKFAELIRELPSDRFRIFVTGVEKEGEEIRPYLIDPFKHSEQDVVDLTGKLSLEQLMHFISKADGMICASTGPVHIAAAFGLHTLGLYAPIKPFDAGRWGPVGKQAEQITLNKDCEACRYESRCPCVEAIPVSDVKARVMAWLDK